jgi:hypothetical protein
MVSPNIAFVVLCEQRMVTLNLSREELLELFTRCLQSTQEDTEHSTTALQKLAKAIDALSLSERQAS